MFQTSQFCKYIRQLVEEKKVFLEYAFTKQMNKKVPKERNVKAQGLPCVAKGNSFQGLKARNVDKWKYILLDNIGIYISPLQGFNLLNGNDTWLRFTSPCADTFRGLAPDRLQNEIRNIREIHILNLNRLSLSLNHFNIITIISGS